MNRILVTALLLATTMGASAQSSIKEMLDKFPQMPSANAIIAFDKQCRQQEDAPSTLSDYLESVEKVENTITNQLMSIEQSNAEQRAAATLAEKVPGLDVSKGQMAQMGKDQQKATAMQSAMSMLANMGLSADDMAKMQNGTMSEADQAALANKVMSKMSGGVSADDIKRMEGMTDAQRAAYMQQKGLATTPSQMPSAPKGKVSSQMVARLQAVESKGREMHQQSLQLIELKATRTQGEALWQQKYAAKYNALHTELAHLIAALTDNQRVTNEQIKANEARYESVKKQIVDIENAFYAEYIPKYHAAIQEALKFVREKEAPAFEEWKRVYDEIYQQTGDPQWKFSGATTLMPVTAYSLLLKKVEDYRKNSQDNTFEYISLE